MRAVDTNVVVRYLVADDDDQFRRAHAIFARGDLFVATSVILETEWVLRSHYRLSSAAVVAGLRAIVGLPGVSIENFGRLDIALQWAAEGMDFADALHLAGARRCESFLTFDRVFAKIASRIADIAVVEL